MFFFIVFVSLRVENVTIMHASFTKDILISNFLLYDYNRQYIYSERQQLQFTSILQKVKKMAGPHLPNIKKFGLHYFQWNKCQKKKQFNKRPSLLIC